MLPATLAHEVKKQVLHYLEATFPMRDPQLEAALGQFFLDPDKGLFKGPWLQLKRPFRLATNSGEQFFDLKVPFTPFRHQWLSWQRLTSKDNSPKPTLVTTGTGSGKTECFLYPLLDHCYRLKQSGKKQGIKAIVLYPMNALASDQAGRFAEEILKSNQLSYDADVNGKLIRKANIRVGLYTGRMQPGQEDRSDVDSGTYSELQIIPSVKTGGKPAYVAITNREEMQGNPPDILLTNYKMLDYLLMRPKDQRIWEHNMQDSALLQYLVLDELHTYDGAQGADVACLIRRLKEHLGIPKGALCVVGTSATIAGGEDETKMDPLDRLCGFAGSLFQENLSNDAVITEDRYEVEEIIRTSVEISSLPNALECQPKQKETSSEFAYRMAPLFDGPSYPVSASNEWLQKLIERQEVEVQADFQAVVFEKDAETQWGLALGEWLRAQPLFHQLLQITNENVVLWTDLLKILSREDFDFRDTGNFEARSQVLMALLALVAHARELRSGRSFPLVPTQIQFWLRELRRIGRIISETPKFSWLDEPLPDKRQLPTVQCTECGESAWVALVDPDMESAIRQHTDGFALIDDYQKIYQGWGFEHLASQHLVILSTWKDGDDPLPKTGGAPIDSGQENVQLEIEETKYYLAPTSLIVRQGPGPCPLTGESTFRIKVTRETNTRGSSNIRFAIKRCPHCQSLDSLMFIGSRAATVASVAIDEVFGSILNNDPKLLAFTDSVQDASHRAGFFSARTYNFSYRTALQHIIDDAGPGGLPIEHVGESLVKFWSEEKPGRPGSFKEVMATLIPPDLREYGAYLSFRDNHSQHIPSSILQKQFIERLNWQATSEFSLMQTHGRTMEVHASGCLGWDQEVVLNTLSNLRSRLPSISPALEIIKDEAFLLWIFGILHRSRERGALYHPFLDSYAIKNYWGKVPFKEVISGRETFPPKGRYRPRLLATTRDKYHDHILSPFVIGSQPPWHVVWIRRVLNDAPFDDNTLLDLINGLLLSGTEAGLFKCLHKDGEKAYYALNSGAAILYPEGVKLVCNTSGHALFRPEWESKIWIDGASLEYRDDRGRYKQGVLNERERYYQDRYRKGALRRVFAHEHTGLLTTEEREALEMSFSVGGHADDPNVLTATSTLEMGIDIGDLSTTMLCSIPPSIASYLQRIGRAGRSTGTALVLAVINQRPHDLFFYARPDELLRGDIEPPGCWLDASAVLVRQYLAFCLDQAVKSKIIVDLPATGKQLVDEMIIVKQGHIQVLLEWMTTNESELQQIFLARFESDVQDDTVKRFTLETRSERLRERIEMAAREFHVQRELLRTANQRLKEQKQKLDPATDEETLREIEREKRILAARTRKLGDISAIEVLIEHGLLPNYAFPERGVRFSGTTYNQHAIVNDLTASQSTSEEKSSRRSKEGRLKTYEIVRSGASAIRELAPANHFYTHSHVFDIQQLEIGSKSDPLIEEWAVCGQCGHMRLAAEVTKPDARPDCPQCGYDGPEGQTDIGQHRACLPFHRSQSVSYMEYYDSLSGGKGEERENEFYRLVTSFDHTIAQASGAVGEDSLPFGIEYREAIRIRELNTGYADQSLEVEFGEDTRVPDGFEICADCGMVVGPGQSRSDVKHRKSCPGRTRTTLRQREGRTGDQYQWQRTWLYRELRSEAIRLLLPEVEKADLDTLEACIYFGMRLRFQGDPTHLMVRPQIIPDHRHGITRHYLVLVDAVPGGTGFLKSLYQNDKGIDGEGVMEVFSLAKNALETCECRRLQQTDDDTDGCYRCIRTYHMQHRAQNISRERGITLLNQLIDAGKNRTEKEALDEIKSISLFGSVLEKRFAEGLASWVASQKGQWQETLINGAKGFKFVIGKPERAWELELQPLLGSAQGVSIGCQPDFMLRCESTDVKPIAIFVDGFEPHVHPGEEKCRLTDDIRKRRAILESGSYKVWSISWDDLLKDKEKSGLEFLLDEVVKFVLRPTANQLKNGNNSVPDISLVAGNPWQQLQAFILCPEEKIWSTLAVNAAGQFMKALAVQGVGTVTESMFQSIGMWQSGYNPPPLNTDNQGDWLWLTRIGKTEDLFACALADELANDDFQQLRMALRLDDSESERSQTSTYRLRWRRFMGMFNLFQFSAHLNVFTTSEAEKGLAPEFEVAVAAGINSDWQDVISEVITALEPFVRILAKSDKMMPEVEYYDDNLGDELFAELAWPDVSKPIAVLTGDQASFANQWQQAGWKIITNDDFAALGLKNCVNQIPDGPKGDN
jgi:DEAD/DEAH box helicase domain-containing protein